MNRSNELKWLTLLLPSFWNTNARAPLLVRVNPSFKNPDDFGDYLHFYRQVASWKNWSDPANQTNHRKQIW